VHVIREDPVNPNLLYLGTDVGLYLSLDQGASWHKWARGFPTVPVHDLKIHPRDRELIVGTHGRSIWVIDVAPLQDLTPQVAAAAEPVLFKPAPGLSYGSPPIASSIGGEYYGHSWFRGDNRPYGAEIAWYTPAALEQPVRITIRDAQGSVVDTLTGSTRAGLQRVRWNMRPRPQQSARELSPSERRDSIATMQRVDIVADSLITAGEDSATVRRVAGMMKGEPQQGFGGGGGGGGGNAFAGAQQREWVDRPGEGNVGQGGGGGFQALGRIAGLFRAAGVPGVPGAQLPGQGFGGGAQPEPVAAGTYTVVVEIGGREYTTSLEVVRGN
jgi:hypothetical protein